MRISDPSSSAISSTGRAGGIGPVVDGKRLRGPSGQPFSSDEVQLSHLSANLTAAQSDSPAWTGKLSHLTAAVAGGSYHVDAHEVSASIINDSLRIGALSHS